MDHLLSSVDSRVCVALLAIGVVTRFTSLNYPCEVAAEEVSVGRSINAYLTGGEFFVDANPPFGKLLLAGGAWIGGYNGSQSWARAGEPIVGRNDVFALRALPALQGAVLAPLMFLAGRAIGLSYPSALVASAGVLLDVCCLVEQRHVLTDATLLLAVALQLAATFATDHHAPLSPKWWRRAALGGVGVAIASGTKWAGVSTLVVPCAHSVLALRRGLACGERRATLMAEAAARVGLFGLLPLTAHLVTSAVHLALLPSAGPGASGMTAAFRAALRGGGDDDAEVLSLREAVRRGDASLPGVLDRIGELTRTMLRADTAMELGERGAPMRWWEWPLMPRSVLHWASEQAPYVVPPLRPLARVYSLGNPFVWWLAALAPAAFVVCALFLGTEPTTTEESEEDGGQATTGADPATRASEAGGADAPVGGAPAATEAAPASAPAEASPAVSGDGEGSSPCTTSMASSDGARHRSPPLTTSGVVLLLGYAAHWLSCARAGDVRPSSFLPALLHALLLAGAVLDLTFLSAPLLRSRVAHDPRIAPLAPPCAHHPDGVRWLVAAATVTAMATGFAHFAPLAFGSPMSEAELASRMWLASWR